MWVFWPICRRVYYMHTAHLILTTMIFDDGCSFRSFTLFQCLAQTQGFPMIFTIYKSTVLKESSITEDILLYTNPKLRYSFVIQKGYKNYLWLLPLTFVLHVVHQGRYRYLYKPSSSNTFSSRYVLSSWTVFSIYFVTVSILASY